MRGATDTFLDWPLQSSEVTQHDPSIFYLIRATQKRSSKHRFHEEEKCLNEPNADPNPGRKPGPKSGLAKSCESSNFVSWRCVLMSLFYEFKIQNISDLNSSDFSESWKTNSGPNLPSYRKGGNKPLMGSWYQISYHVTVRTWIKQVIYWINRENYVILCWFDDEIGELDAKKSLSNRFANRLWQHLF